MITEPCLGTSSTSAQFWEKFALVLDVMIIEPSLRYIKYKCTSGIPKCLQQCENVGTNEVIFTILYTLKCNHVRLIFMDPCILDYSPEIPTRCSFVTEFIIPKFTEGSTCFERHTAHHQEL